MKLNNIKRNFNKSDIKCEKALFVYQRNMQNIKITKRILKIISSSLSICIDPQSCDVSRILTKVYRDNIEVHKMIWCFIGSSRRFSSCHRLIAGIKTKDMRDGRCRADSTIRLYLTGLCSASERAVRLTVPS